MADTAAQQVHQAISLLQAGHLPRASKLLEEALRHRPRHGQALLVLGIVRAMQGRKHEAIELLQQAALAAPEQAQPHFNLAKVLSECGQDLESLPHHQQALRLEPSHVGAWLNFGRSLNNLNRFDEALTALDKALALKANYAEAWTTRGVSLNGLGRNEEARQSHERSLQLNPDLAEAWNNLGVTCMHLHQMEDGLLCCDRALAMNPALASAWVTKGQLQAKFGNREGALVSLVKATEIDSTLVSAWISLGNLRTDLGDSVLATEAFAKAIALQPNITYAKGLLLGAKMTACDWSDYTETCTHIQASIERGELVAGGASLLPTHLPRDIVGKASVLCTEHETRHQAPDGETFLEQVRSQTSAKAKIRVGYISSDFNQHPVGQLSQHLFKHHDKDAFEIIGFFLTEPANHPITQNIQHQFDAWHDLSDMDMEAALCLIRQQQLDIAVNLNGYTKDNRTELFARRIAPIQVNYLGYPGTMGGANMDYILADARVIPPEDEPHYTEKVVHLPHSFFITHNPGQSPAPSGDVLTARQEQGIPQTGFIFSCFNNSHKIDPHSFDSWMRILRGVPDSVLWLSGHKPFAQENLRKEAASRGVAPDRLVFAKREELHSDHLRRISLADLFIDTRNYNAHTTACEALMMGVPVLTCTGQTFAGKVAHSLLHAIGLPEMVTHDLNGYEQRAIQLATTHRHELHEIRQRLHHNRRTHPLFDNALTTRKIEEAYRAMVQRWREELPPEHLDIAP